MLYIISMIEKKVLIPFVCSIFYEKSLNVNLNSRDIKITALLNLFS